MEVCTTRQHFNFTTFCDCKKKGANKMAIEKGDLIHWWHYYGKAVYTLAELEEFEKIIDEYGVDKVLDLAVASYICGDGSPTIILMSIRRGIVKELFETLPDASGLGEDAQKLYKKIREDFIQIISQTT